MKILVTGGAGFIGSHLVDRLLQVEDNQVLVLDDLSEGKLAYLPMENDRLKVVVGSILSASEMLYQDVDIVYHLAALPRPQLSIVDPLPANRVNVSGTLRVLTCCLHLGVRRVVFLSSASLYGEQLSYPCRESARPNPMSPYGLQKYIGEQYCQLFNQIYGLDFMALRLFNTYGPRMNPNGEYASLIPKFIGILRREEQPEIYGSGEQRRDYIYVSDVVEMLVRAAECEDANQVVNAGSGMNYSVNEVTQIIRELLGSPIKARYGEPVIEPTQTLADTHRAEQALGYRTRIGLRVGIQRTIEALG